MLRDTHYKSDFIPGLVTLTFSRKKKKKKKLFLGSIFSEVISQTVTLTIKTNLNYPSNQKMQKVLSKKFRNRIF